MKLNRKAVIDSFRNAVLYALDECAGRTFRRAKLPDADPGANDEDVRTLLPIIDAQVERLAARYGVELTREEETWPPPT